MSLSGPALKRIGLGLFAIGVLLAFVLTVLLVWADVEAFSYGFPRLGNQPMGGLACPQLMNSAQPDQVTLTLRNTQDRDLRPQVQVLISEPGMARWSEVTMPVEIAAGDSQTLRWDLGSDNIVLGSFVFVKAYTFASYPQPNTEGACGVFVFAIPGLNGDVLYWLWLALSAALLAAGLWLSDLRKDETRKASSAGRARKALAVLAGLGLVAGSAGWWPIGGILLLVMALTLLALLVMGQSM